MSEEYSAVSEPDTVDDIMDMEVAGTNADVLEILRNLNGPTLEGYGSLDKTIETMREELSASLKSFTGESMELEIAEIAIFDGVSNPALPHNSTLFARIDADDDYLLACLGTSRATFRRLLGIAFSGFENAGSEFSDTEFTVAGKPFVPEVH